MDVLKEYEKFHGISRFDATLQSAGSKVKSQPIANSLDSLITKLNAAKAELETGTSSTDVAKQVKTIVEQEKKEVDERLKEIHASLNRVGKALDKVSHWHPPRKTWCSFPQKLTTLVSTNPRGSEWNRQTKLGQKNSTMHIGTNLRQSRLMARYEFQQMTFSERRGGGCTFSRHTSRWPAALTISESG